MTISSVSKSTTAGPIDTAGNMQPANTGAPATLMPQPSSPDIGFDVAKMVIESSFNARKGARQDRQHAKESMVAAQKAQIAHLRQEADDRYTAAQLEAWGKIGEGALGIAGGAAKLGGSAGWSDTLTSGGKTGSGVTSLIAAGFTHDASDAAAAAKTAEMEAGAQKNALDGADDEIKETREHVRNALDFLREFQSTEAKSMSAAIRA